MENLQRHCKALYRKLCSELRIDICDAALLMPAVCFALNCQRSPRYGCIPMEAFTQLRAKSPLRTVCITGVDIREAVVMQVTAAVWAAAAVELQAARRSLDNMHRRLAEHKATVRVRSRTVAGKASTKRGRRPMMPRIDIGDFVLVALPEKRSHKLEFNWQGPYVVEAPRMTENPVRSAQGVPHVDVCVFPRLRRSFGGSARREDGRSCFSHAPVFGARRRHKRGDRRAGAP